MVQEMEVGFGEILGWWGRKHLEFWEWEGTILLPDGDALLRPRSQEHGSLLRRLVAF